MKDRLGTLGQQKEALSDEEFYRQFLKEQGGLAETEEDRFLDEMFRAELDRDVEREEALLAEHPEITGMEPSPDLFDRIMAKAAEMDNGKTEAPADAEVEREEATDFEADGGEKEETPDQMNEPEENEVRPMAKVTMMKSGNAEAAGTTNETADEGAAYRPEDFLNEEDRRALEIGRKRMKHQKKHRWVIHFAANAAILACVFLVGVSTEANRTRIVNVINTWVGDESLAKVDNETDREQVRLEQEKADLEIEEELGIKPVHFMHEVDGMKFDGYEIDTRAKMARLFYSYKDSIITILMRKDEKGTAKGSIKDGSIKEIFEVNTDIGVIDVASIEGETVEKYMTEFVYDNTYYHIFGKLPKEEFVNLISSIFF